MSDLITEKIMPETPNKEYEVSIPIYDVRDYNPEAPVGIYTFGGFIGEVLLTLSALE